MNHLHCSPNILYAYLKGWILALSHRHAPPHAELDDIGQVCGHQDESKNPSPHLSPPLALDSNPVAADPPQRSRRNMSSFSGFGNPHQISSRTKVVQEIIEQRREFVVLGFAAAIDQEEEEQMSEGFTNSDLALQRELFMYSMVRGGDRRCISQVRMSTFAFNQLCDLVKSKGFLQSTRHLTIDEQMTMFLYTLAHNVGNRSISMYFCRSRETVHRHFHRCLRAILQLYEDCVPSPDNEMHPKITSDPTVAPYFQGCIGAIDGTHIPVLPPSENALAFRHRHGKPTQNVMAACDFNLKFTYILAGWEGSAHDAKVLQSTLDWSANRFTIRQGHYYLVDAGYAHVPGFMAPYKGVSHHMSSFRHGRTPRNRQELFNFRHARLHTTIERLFAIWKKRFPTLQVATSYPYRVQVQMVIACAILHNYITSMDGPELPQVIEEEERLVEEDVINVEDEEEEINTMIRGVSLEARNAWRDKREKIAVRIWDNM